ncbi:MAG: hypothetical protein E6G43_12225 [Actinobacteria bacterium]|nr:MAG: hypothetical protein E6G43_12225 [Actinomycetota bacterium]
MATAVARLDPASARTTTPLPRGKRTARTAVAVAVGSPPGSRVTATLWTRGSLPQLSTMHFTLAPGGQ